MAFPVPKEKSAPMQKNAIMSQHRAKPGVLSAHISAWRVSMPANNSTVDRPEYSGQSAHCFPRWELGQMSKKGMPNQQSGVHGIFPAKVPVSPRMKIPKPENTADTHNFWSGPALFCRISFSHRHGRILSCAKVSGRYLEIFDPAQFFPLTRQSLPLN